AVRLPTRRQGQASCRIGAPQAAISERPIMLGGVNHGVPYQSCPPHAVWGAICQERQHSRSVIVKKRRVPQHKVEIVVPVAIFNGWLKWVSHVTAQEAWLIQLLPQPLGRKD